MNITKHIDNPTFSYLVVDDFYSEEEQKLVWEDLRDIRTSFKSSVASPEKGGPGQSPDGVSLANSSRVYLDEVYANRRNESNILSLYTDKIFSEEIKDAYKETTPAHRNFISCDIDYSQVSYYDHGGQYKSHYDVYMHTCLIWFFREPKRFTGGELIFPESNEVVECRHNRMILFPSYYLHQATEVLLEEEFSKQWLGRFCLTHFFSRK